MKAATKARRREQRRADQIKEATTRLVRLEHSARVARAELDRRIELALADDASHLAQAAFVKSSLGGLLDVARQLKIMRARLARLGGVQ